MKPSLKPSFNLFSATMLVMGSIIGSGVFKKIAPMAGYLHSGPWILLCWVAAGIITLFGALTYAEIAGRIAQTGGLFHYLKVIFGPPVGFIFGWACLTVMQTASIASLAFVFAESLASLFPMILSYAAVPTIASICILFITVLNILGVIVGVWLENIFTVLKILGIFVIVALAFYFGKGPAESFCWACNTQAANPLSFASIPLFFSAMMGAFWAYDGINNIGFIAGEIQNPKKNIPRALVFGVLGVIFLYLVINTAYLYAMPLQKIASISGSGQVFAIELAKTLDGANTLFWPIFVAILILISSFGAANASILSSSRIYYAMAQEGLFFRSFGKLSEKYNTPVVSLVVQSLWACVLVFSGSFDQLTDWLIFSAFIFYGLGAYGLFRLRKLGIGTPPFRVPTPIAGIYIVFCACLVVVSIWQNPISSLIGLLLILMGIPLYYYFARKMQ
jgi:APA family basic amino acid/polyamine antiporter